MVIFVLTSLGQFQECTYEEKNTGGPYDQKSKLYSSYNSTPASTKTYLNSDQPGRTYLQKQDIPRIPLENHFEVLNKLSEHLNDKDSK